MEREAMARRLAEIEAADSIPAVIGRLREHLSQLGDATWSRVPLSRVQDVSDVAIGIARLRLKHGGDERLAELEALFARASVRVAELLDRTGGWQAFEARAAEPRPGTHR